MRQSAEAESSVGLPLEEWFAGELTAPMAPVRDDARPRGLLGRVNGVAVLLVLVDFFALLVMTSNAEVAAPWAVVLACALLGVRASGRIYRRRLMLSWLQDLPRSLAWVLGAEGEGMRRLTRESCDLLVQIPMAGAVESLNVSVSAGICLYESMRRRRAPS